MTEDLKAAYDELEAKLDNLIEENLSGKKDDSQFANLVAVYQFQKKLLPYHEELQNLDCNLISTIGFVFELLLEKPLSPKKEQEIKRKLKESKDIFNNFDGSKEDKKQRISEIAGQIYDMFQEIIGLATVSDTV